MTAGLLAFALVFSGMNMPVGAYAEELLSDETSIVSEEYESSVSEGYFVTEDVSESQPETEDEADITEADETEESEEEEIILSEEEGYASTEDGMIALTYMDTPGDHNAPAYYPSSKGGVDALRSTPLPSKYNSTLEELAEQSYPNTRQQNPWGSCWAHAAMATAEISMIKQGHANSSVDYSEFALAYFFYNTVEDPLGGTHGDKTELKAQSGETLGNTSSTMNYMERGGNNAFTWRALATWMGATEEKGAVVYPHSSSLPADPADSYAYDDAAILKDVRIYNPNTNRDGVKEAIRQSGAVAGSIYWSDGFYNSTYNSYYNPNTSTNHAITIVGWDDDFPASNFEQWTDSDGKTYPEGNGAWLVRNSWSETPRFSRLSYLWLSYEDKSINAGNLYQQIFVPASTYDNNYQYDGCVETSGSHRNKVANIFTIKGLAGSNAEILKAVSFSISEASDVPYTIKVYKNVEAGKPESGSLAATVSGTTTYAGYYTVDLDTPVLMARNTRFSVVVETEGDNKCVDVEFGYTGHTWISFSCDSSDGESFVYSNDKWVEPSSVFFSSYSVGNICVKAFTKDAVVDGKYRICFDGNGSTSGSMAFLNVSPGEEIQLSANKFERKGWFFKGWNTDPDG
ncbi:MAG: InlB B-repeat-containing protein, partial [Lachnospiraceae bacterium]|nr:InlB B-repeat-containing protein [Lachnospiraceae bacterium]